MIIMAWFFNSFVWISVRVFQEICDTTMRHPNYSGEAIPKQLKFVRALVSIEVGQNSKRCHM